MLRDLTDLYEIKLKYEFCYAWNYAFVTTSRVKEIFENIMIYSSSYDVATDINKWNAAVNTLLTGQGDLRGHLDFKSNQEDFLAIALSSASFASKYSALRPFTLNYGQP